ncbi:MAG: M67 family metallopeptidase [Candidatus Thorarchaeota archaeon]|nr:M67 family metallopeptidase [Candidatus Thorarchaeota archaeon]
MDCCLVLNPNHLKQLHAHAENCLPNEAVALLFGVVKDSSIVIKRIEMMVNTAESRTTFSVEPTVQYRLLVEAEELEEALVCIFHSHPAPPKPSQSDLKNMELNPVVWLIASRNSGSWESRAYLLEEKRVKEVEISLFDEVP